MMGIAQNYPSSTFRVPSVNTGEIAICQNVSWHRETPEVQGYGDKTAESWGCNSTGGGKC